MTALNAYRPRRWRGALLPKTAVVRIDVLDNTKRPVMADADSISFKNVKKLKLVQRLRSSIEFFLMKATG